MTTSGSTGISERTPLAKKAHKAAGGPLGASQRGQGGAGARMSVFVLVRILFQYLDRVDKPVLALAKEVLKDCERKHKSRDSKYKTLVEAINERVRDAVGEAHWAQARRIQKQLALNQQAKKLKAMQAARRAAGLKTLKE